MTLLNQFESKPFSEIASGDVALTWLGQAGFLVSSDERSLLVDPYLSDSLAKKYQGKLFPHTRLLPIPVQIDKLPKLSAYLMTHGHTDHMDPETIQAVSKVMQTRYVFPKHELEKAFERGVPQDEAEPINAGDELEFDGITVTAVPAAHEQIQVDEFGYYHALGYVIKLKNLTIYHSGDCVPYTGQAELLARYQIDVALLPINGRDEYRLKNGVPGNFHASEALELCEKAGIPMLIPHHFGMFDFNTVNPDQYQELFAASSVNVVVPKHGRTFSVPAGVAR